MQGSDSFLLELLSASRRRFIIPVYQRNYDWKKADPAADTFEEESKIDKLVYDLYGLTPEEIAIID